MFQGSYKCWHFFICLHPITSKGQNGQKKYQINLKSHSGPIHVLLINKESSSSKPVVFPVPPPDDLTQPSSQPSTPVTPQKSTTATQNLPEQHISERSQNLQQTAATDVSSGEFRAFVLKSREGKIWRLYSTSWRAFLNLSIVILFCYLVRKATWET